MSAVRFRCWRVASFWVQPRRSAGATVSPLRGNSGATVSLVTILILNTTDRHCQSSFHDSNVNSPRRRTNSIRTGIDSMLAPSTVRVIRQKHQDDLIARDSVSPLFLRSGETVAPALLDSFTQNQATRPS